MDRLGHGVGRSAGVEPTDLDDLAAGGHGRNAGRDLSEEREDEPVVRLRDVDAEQLPGLGDDAAFLEDLALRRLTRSLTRLDLAARRHVRLPLGLPLRMRFADEQHAPVSVEDDSTRTVFHARSVFGYTRGPEAATSGGASGTNFSKFD